MRRLLLCIVVGCIVLHAKVDPLEGLWQGYDGEWGHVSRQLIAHPSFWLGYEGDSWRVTEKLTLKLWPALGRLSAPNCGEPGGAGSFDPATGAVLAAGIGSVPRNLDAKPYNLGFVPRIAVAYRALAGTVIRTGLGRSFTPAGLGAVFGQGFDHNPPIVNAPSVTPSNFYLPAFNLLNSPSAPTNVSIGPSGRYPLPDGIAIFDFIDPPGSYRTPEVNFWKLHCAA
jgi:hypothetical protein